MRLDPISLSSDMIQIIVASHLIAQQYQNNSTQNLLWTAFQHEAKKNAQFSNFKHRFLPPFDLTNTIPHHPPPHLSPTHPTDPQFSNLTQLNSTTTIIIIINPLTATDHHQELNTAHNHTHPRPTTLNLPSLPNH